MMRQEDTQVDPHLTSIRAYKKERDWMKCFRNDVAQIKDRSDEALPAECLGLLELR